MLWDPDVLGRLGALNLRARQLVSGWLHGAHASPHTASNVEFADYKEYSPGDLMRDVDWRVAARTDRLVVRRHRAETELATTICIDASGDLATGRSSPGERPPLDGTKWGVAATLAATVAWYLHRRSEPVGLMVLGGEDVRWPWMPPRTGGAHLAQIMGCLAQVRPAGQADLGQGLSQLGSRIRRRSLVVLISDLMEEPATWGPQLAAVGARSADIRVVHLYDPGEWRLDYPAAAQFFSPEGGDLLPLDPATARPAFQGIVDEYLHEVRGHLRSWRAQHVLTPTDQPLDEPLARILRGLP